MGMPKYDRLLYIMNRLRSQRNLNARSLADECEVTERTIYRDMLSLSEVNIPIHYDNGYKLASDLFMPPLNFTLDEYTCLRLALESTPLAKIGSLARTLKEIRAKVDARLSEQVRQLDKFTPTMTSLEIDAVVHPERGERYYTTIEKSAAEELCLEIAYESISSGHTVRTVEPYFIVFRGRSFYFVAFCRLRADFRTFRIDRVIDVKVTGERFVRKREVTPETYFANSWRMFSGEPVTVVVRFSGRAAGIVKGSRHLDGEGISPDGDNAILYRVETRGVEEIRRWILGFGAEAEVLEPVSLRGEIAEAARALAGVYE